MILFTEATVPRKWRCPICKLKCYDIIIDSYMQKIIQTFKEQNLNVIEISFDKEANYEIHKLKKEGEDDEDFDDDIPVKPVANTSNTTTANTTGVAATQSGAIELEENTEAKASV